MVAILSRLQCVKLLQLYVDQALINKIGAWTSNELHWFNKSDMVLG